MKSLLFAALLFVSQAYAETITFSESPCSGFRVCANVVNDAALDIDLYAQSNRLPTLMVAGDNCIGTVADVGLRDIVDAPMLCTSIDAEGNVVSYNATLSVTFRHWVTRVNQGRAHYNSQHWAITSGAFTR
jgi:hypothetical protein